MRKLVYMFLVAGAMIFASCGSDAAKVESGDAQQVEQNESESAVTYSQVQEGSHVAWRASHLAGMQPRWGKAMLQSAEVKVDGGKVVNAKVVMDMKKFTVDNFEGDAEKTQKLLGHLQSGDFFKVEEFPHSTFEVTSVESGNDEYNSKVTGNLTILDVTKSISFLANIEVSDNQLSIKSEDFEVDRKDWGLTYNTEGTVGVPTDYLIADEVGFTIDVNLAK